MSRVHDDCSIGVEIEFDSFPFVSFRFTMLLTVSSDFPASVGAAREKVINSRWYGKAMEWRAEWKKSNLFPMIRFLINCALSLTEKCNLILSVLGIHERI